MEEKFTKFGAFGCVKILLGEDGKLYARKHLEPKDSVLECSDLNNIKARFAREVKVQRSLPPDYFMPILEAGLNDDPPWFLMPCADETFEDFIKSNRKNFEVVEPALFDILNALEILEGMEIKHRDLKPGNILKHEGKWKLTDFGLVSAGTEFSGPLSSVHSVWGSAPYCSPEQLMDFKHVTCATDIYSFGCILHDIYVNAQRLPYRQQTADGPIGVIIEKCTAELPSKRFKTIGGLKSALLLALKSPPTDELSSTVEAYIISLADVSVWDEKKFNEFARFLRQPLGIFEKEEIFTALDPDNFEFFQQHQTAWNVLITFYCEQTRGNHSFSFCDVIGSNLKRLYDLGSLSDRVDITMAAAFMARSHNRYYVMKILQRLAGPSIDDNLAMRLAIEIDAEDAQEDFRECAPIKERGTFSCYHPVIAECLRRETAL